MSMYPMARLMPIIASHNSLLTIFAEQGLIGGGLFVGALLAFLVHMYRARGRVPMGGVLGRDLLMLLMIAVIGHVLSTLDYDVRYFRYPTYFQWILLAVGVRIGEIGRKEEAEEQSEAPASPEPLRSLAHV